MVQVRTIPVSGVAVTGADGKYSLNGLKLGKYTVVASKPGYFEHKVTVDVSSENTTVDILLTPRRAQTPVVHGLVSHCPFDGSTRDQIGNGPDALIYDVLWVPDRFGKPNCALHFNGTSSYARLGNALSWVFSAPVAKFTVTGWANTDAYPSLSGAGCIIAKSYGATSGPYQWSVTHDFDGRLKGAVMSRLDASAFLVKSSEVFPVGRWFHFALVFDGSLPETDRVQLYVDGIPGSLSRHAGRFGVTTEMTNQEVTLGATHEPGNPLAPANFYEGTIDDIRIYDQALSQREIEALAGPGKK
jgi:hypothetical protein